MPPYPQSATAPSEQAVRRKHDAVRRKKADVAGWSWGCVATVDREGRTIFVADAHRGDGQRYVVHAEEKATAFLELERAICLRLLTDQIKR
jgi:hypothetical protein